MKPDHACATLPRNISSLRNDPSTAVTTFGLFFRRLGALTFLVPSLLQSAAPPDFNRDIRPILSDKCIRCHGPDKDERKGGEDGLRLDTSEGARTDLGGGGYAIVPGDLEKSELIARVTSTDEDEVMPPPKTGKKLTAQEIELLKGWIAAGASYASHWSYEKPRRAAVPLVRDQAWPKGALDRFILARIEKTELRPQPEADRAVLARRVALDLTGLPPSVLEVEAFMADASANAYERFVDRQLAKPAYGEHWARLWLDLARYADSKGYADDQRRSIWRYRDYVIDAFNQNMPFDRFTIEQLAGDLLPNPTQEQLFATGFHRNTMTNTEGGTDDEEFRSAAVVDRVNTTMAVWMGTSMACAQCHTHKYDPLTQKEYFQLYALFNQTDDADRADEAPVIEFYTDAQKSERAKWESEIAALTGGMLAAKTAHAEAAEKWARNFPARIAWDFSKPNAFTSAAGAAAGLFEDGRILVTDDRQLDTYTVEVPVPAAARVTAIRLEALPHDTLPEKGPGGADGNFVVTRFGVGIKPPEPFRQARYVRVELPGKARTLSLAEVEVYSGGKNVAGQGIATQSSTAMAGEACRAIDGNTAGDAASESVNQTERSQNPWWELDLNSSRPLERVVVWGRTDEVATPAGLRLTILDDQKRPLFTQVAREALKPKRRFNLADPSEVALGRVFVDFAQSDFDESLIAGDVEADAANRRKRTATRKGWGIEGAAGQRHTLTVEPGKPFALQPGEKLIVTIEQKSIVKNATLNHFRLGVTVEPEVGRHLRTPAAEIAVLQVPAGERSAAERERLLDYYVLHVAPDLQPGRRKVAALRKSLEEMPLNSSPIMRELPADKRRRTHVQLRGNFKALGEEVTGGVPAVFPPLPEGAPLNRLGLAQWLVDAGNPLTARVVANRFWDAIFGIGLVRTAEEFGSQGEPPSHPELLDWLALDLVESNWDIKRFLKTLVTSAAYRQSSKVTPEALAVDPENRLLARGPRFRLAAEMVRDQALAVSGLLSPKLHGPSTRPYQPAFDLKAAFGSTLDWTTSEGEDRFRRGVYTEWRRSSPYPSMVTFDAPNREVCTLRRNVSNTPLQALVTLNDPVYVEAAQMLARLMGEGADRSIEQRVREGFLIVLARQPTAVEIGPVATLYRNALDHYRQEPEKAASLIANPDNPPAPSFNPAELAAWTTVANVLLNLDETLMKR